MDQVKLLIKLNHKSTQRSGILTWELLSILIMLLVNVYSDMNESLWRLINSVQALALLSFLTYFVKQYSDFKRVNVKENYGLLGLNQGSFNKFWFIFYYLKGLTYGICFIVIAIIQNQFVDHIDGQFMAFILFFFAIIALVQQAFCFVQFFRTSNYVITFYLLFYIISSLLFLVGGRDPEQDGLNIILAIILPQFALAMGLNQRQDWDVSYLNAPNLEPYVYLILLIVSFIVYLIIFFITQAVINSKNPKKSSDKTINDQQDDQIKPIYKEKDVNYQDLTKLIECQNVDGIANIKPQIQNLQISLYENQIFTIYGSQNSGKSTILQIFAKQQGISKGNVQYISNDNNVISYIGSQLTLLPYITVQEHLKLISLFKGIPENQRQQQILEQIETFQLQNEQNLVVESLSNFSKIKLSIALSVIGNTQILLMDEPTKNLNDQQTDFIIESIKKLKAKNRLIIFTTSKAKEAIQLSDRTAILINGRIRIEGSLQYIKEKLGLGYYLDIELKDKSDIPKEINSKINDIVNTSIIDNAVLLTPSTIKNKLSYSIPWTAKDHLSHLFKDLKGQVQNLQFSIKTCSLQETFESILIQESQISQSKISQINGGNTTFQTNLNIISEQNLQMQQIKSHNVLLNDPKSPNSQKSEKSESSQHKFDFTPTISQGSQICSIFKKKIIQTFKSPCWILLGLIPLIFFVVGPILASAEKFKEVEYTFLADEVNDKMKIKYKLNPELPDLDSQSTFLKQFISFGLCFAMYYFAQPIVEEKERKLKPLLNIHGLKIAPYWIGNFLVDYLWMILYIIVFVIVGLSLDNMDIISKPIGSWVLIIIPGFAACLLQSYSLSYLFQKTSQVQKYLVILLLIFQFGIPSLLIIPIDSEDNSQKYAIANVIFYVIFPIFGVNQGGTSVVEQYKDDLLANPIKYDKAPHDGEIIFDPKSEFPSYTGGLNEPYQFFILYIIQMIVYYFMVYYLDQNSCEYKSELENEICQSEIKQLDKTVIDEQKRLLDQNNKDELIKIQGLGKQYSKNVTGAKNVTIGLKKGEIFAIVGPDQSGKSSITNTITGIEQPSCGKISFFDEEIKSLINNYNENIGYCPQFYPIWPKFTLRRHLEIFGSLKGMNSQLLQAQINSISLSLGINSKSLNTNGSNLTLEEKQNMWIAISILGKPKILIMDSPNQGIEFGQTLEKIEYLKPYIKSNNCTAIITTKSILEAEVISDRIGIMVNGEITTLNNLQSLQQKYSKNMVITVQSDQNNEQNLKELIEKTFKQFNQNKLPVLEYQSQSQSQVNKKDQKQSSSLVIYSPADDFDINIAFQVFDNLFEKQEIYKFCIKIGSIEEFYTQICEQQQVKTTSTQII